MIYKKKEKKKKGENNYRMLTKVKACHDLGIVTKFL